MILFIYNYDYSEQSIRQIETIISFVEADKIVLSSEWQEIFKNTNVDCLKFMKFLDFITLKGEKGVIFFNIIDGYKLKNYKNSNDLYFIFRPRGLLPEESYYKNKNIIKKLVLDHYENRVIKYTDYFIFLNQQQKIHFIKKYSKFKRKLEKGYILPNIKINISNILPQKTQRHLSIVYSGGFSKWQNIDLIFELMRTIILDYNINCIFTILTFKENFEKAKKLARHHKIDQKLVLKYIDPTNLDAELVNHNIGIIIRDNNIINKTASPFKVIDYIANGLALIITDNISWQVKPIINADFYFELSYDARKLRYNEIKFKKFLLNNLQNNNKEQIIADYRKYINNINKIEFKK